MATAALKIHLSRTQILNWLDNYLMKINWN